GKDSLERVFFRSLCGLFMTDDRFFIFYCKWDYDSQESDEMGQEEQEQEQEQEDCEPGPGRRPSAVHIYRKAEEAVPAIVEDLRRHQAVTGKSFLDVAADANGQDLNLNLGYVLRRARRKDRLLYSWVQLVEMQLREHYERDGRVLPEVRQCGDLLCA